MSRKLIYLVAGEASGDVLGARLMRAILTQRPGADFAGVGGAAMAAAGLQSLFPMGELAFMGLLEVAPRVLHLRRRLRETAADIARQRPDVVVTIDSPGFTLRLLRLIRPLGVPRVHYVAPQVWAWRENRVRRFPGLWDDLLCLLPFEPAFFARHGVPATFVGHPVLESGADRGDAGRFRARHGLAPEARVMALLPGSRRTEVSRLLPVFGATLQRLSARVPGLLPVVALAGPVSAAVRAATTNWPVGPVLVEAPEDKHDAFAASAAALSKSGTSTLELALTGTPMVVAYRVNPVTAALVRRMVRVEHASLLNLLSAEPIVPELLQAECTPERLSAALTPLLLDPHAAERQRDRFRAVLDTLRPPCGTPSDAAAAVVLRCLDGKRPVGAKSL